VQPADDPIVSYNLAELFERVADAVPERVAIVTPAGRWSYAQLEARANRLAHALRDLGVASGDHVGLQLHNGVEYLEAMLAGYKLGAVPVNVNYRYVESELAQLYDNADLRALVYHRAFAPRIATALLQTPIPGPLLMVDDDSGNDAVEGSIDYEQTLATASPVRDFTGRSSDDVYIAYTGGTTGLPKGVVWRHEDIFFGAMGGGDPTTLEGPISNPEQIVERILPTGAVMLLVPPLMHVSAQWGAFSILYGGGTVVLASAGSLDAHEIWSLVAEERANVLTIVGDAMARPLLDALADNSSRYDLSSLFVFASGGAVLSGSTKAQVADLLPNVITIDGYGSTETGVSGTRSRMPGAQIEEGTRFTIDAHSAVLDNELQRVVPGSGVIGRLARRGHVPVGYYNDAEATANTFVQSAGVRWALTGDAATVDVDGTIVLLGRGSVSINTGGEKVYPEEVEAVVKDHPAVYDAVVVGTPHDRWGEQVVAVVATRSGTTVTLAEIRDHCRVSLAGYKLPRALYIVDTVVRGPNGKSDYQWARERALESGD
jgi:acyl-CoA synthetase (AMP-forming)/AMP-acid ligase II